MVKERIEYLDLLRVCAVFFVIVIHVSSSNFGLVDSRSFEWNVFNFFDSISRWGVPVFFMISGSLFLSRDVDVKKLYGKYIKRLAVCFLVWNIIYALWHTGASVAENLDHKLIFKTILQNFYTGQVHLWFIPTLAGLYVIVPILRQIVHNRKAVRYFLIISFIVSFAVPWLMNLIRDFLGWENLPVIAWVNKVVGTLNLQFVSGMTFYFLLGYYLRDVCLTLGQKRVIYAMGILGGVLTIALNGIIAWDTHKPCSNYYEYSSVNVILEAFAVFVLARCGKYENMGRNKFLADISKYVFGIYLVHMLVLSIITRMGLRTVSFNPLVSIPLISIIVFLLSLGISIIMSKIPFVKKWMM